MRIGVPRETRTGERLVAASPASVEKLIKLGYEVAVEAGAGTQASFLDEQYQAAGATLVDAADAWGADIVTCVNAPKPAQIKLLREGATLVATMAPQSNEKLVATLAKKGVTALALDAVPRISRAQSIDVLSTMSNVAGYRAVIEAAEVYGGMFTGQVTAAGKTGKGKSSEAQSQSLGDDKRDAVSLELADILIYLIRIAERLDIDLVDAANRKLAINEQRYPAERVRGDARRADEY